MTKWNKGIYKQVDVAFSKITQVICNSIAVPIAVHYLWLFINQILINMQEMSWELQFVSNPFARACSTIFLKDIRPADHLYPGGCVLDLLDDCKT